MDVLNVCSVSLSSIVADANILSLQVEMQRPNGVLLLRKSIDPGSLVVEWHSDLAENEFSVFFANLFPLREEVSKERKRVN